MSDTYDALAVQTSPDGFTVSLAANGTAVLAQHAEAGRRPYLHPVHAPQGGGVITEDTPSHHPWQHGLYVGLNDVNGVGFWKEGLQASTAAGDGSFSSRLVSPPQDVPNGIGWEVATDYLDPSGIVMLQDTQRWTARSAASRLELDMDWTLTGCRDLVFGQYPYGGLFLRMPYRRDTGGVAIDSEGQSADGRPARWVAVTMAVPDTGRTVEAAMLDHPGNDTAPVHWRIDGELGIGPSPSIAGPWSLADGELRVFRYRLLVFPSPVTTAEVDAEWQRYAREAGR